MKNNIIVICGFSASGKDKITKYIADNYNYKMVISHTSRPMRPNESEGDPYHFVSRKEFEIMMAKDEFIECRKYNTLVKGIPDLWFYGVHKDSINLSKHSYVVVLDLLGLIEFKKHFKEDIISFFINVDYSTRRQRCINREGFDETEWDRRSLDDEENFTYDIVNKECDYMVDNYNFDTCIEYILNKIEGND